MSRRGQDAMGTPTCGISQVVEIMPACADMVTRLPLLSSLPCHLGRAEKFGMGWVGHFWRKQPGLGCGCSGVPFGRAVHIFAFAAFTNWVKKGSFLAAWAVPPLSSCSCVAGDWEGRGRTTQRGRSPVVPHALAHMRMDMALLSGRTLESGVGHCLPVCGGLSHP